MSGPAWHITGPQSPYFLQAENFKPPQHATGTRQSGLTSEFGKLGQTPALSLNWGLFQLGVMMTIVIFPTLKVVVVAGVVQTDSTLNLFQHPRET
jgi:hypothetical protein